MAYDRYDSRYRQDRWRDSERSSGGRGRYDRDDDRGFFDRAGDEVRSWFGDEEAERRREMDERRYSREQGYAGGRDNNSGSDNRFSGRTTGAGWGNQRGWRDDRWDRDYGSSSGSAHEGYGEFSSAGGGGGGGADTWGGSGFGGDYDRGRRSDRVDAGSTGTHGAHPMSSPVGAGSYGGGYGIGASGGYGGSSARSYAARNTGRDHDPHYSEWRNRQIETLDRDYDDYRREHQSKFESEFGSWRERRQGQRSALGKVREHMEVVGSDDQHVGTVDKVSGDRIILTKTDRDAGGIHHSIPCSWIESVDDKVRINKSADDAQKAWRDEEHNRALYERPDQGRGGPHALNRSFSGTYGDDDR